jgi:hypothetical protein
MSIVDVLIMLAMFAGWLLIALFVLGCIGVVAILRWWFRSIEEPDERNVPPVRTRIIRPHTPIATDIADVLHREYPDRKPAQFV